MKNTVIQHTFLKFDQSQKTKIFNKNARIPDKTEKKNRSSEQNLAVATLPEIPTKSFARLYGNQVNRKNGTLNLSRDHTKAFQWQR